MDNERPTPLVEDLDATRRKLQDWFSQQRGQPMQIANLSIPEGTGMSNVTLLFELQWQQDGRQHSEACVGRLQPEIERPVFPDYDLGLQYQVMAAVGAHSDIPVPELLGLELDKSVLGVQFYIMKKVEGRIPSDMPPYNMDGWLLQDTDETQRARLWRAAVDTMARYHRLDRHQLAVSGLPEPGSDSALQAQLDYWQRYHDWAYDGQPHDIGQRALDWLQANQPRSEPTTLCWGDARIGNMIFPESLDRVAAVLDWEMAVLGNPVQDIAWFNYLDATFSEGLGMPRLPGLPSYEETVTQWEQVSGHSARDYDYYWIFAGMRYGLILSRIMYATGQAGEVQGNFAAQLLKKYLDAR